MKRFAHFILIAVTSSACSDADRGPPAPYSFDSATDTILLEDRAGHVVAHMTELLEWQGLLVVADGQENNLKLYDPETGELVHVIGRSGSGPGEFVSLAGAAVTPAGRLVTLDALLHRVTYFDADREPVASWMLPGNFGKGIATLPDGDVVAAGRLVADMRVISDSAVHRFSPAGERRRAYFVYPPVEHYGERSLNSMRAIVVDSTVIGLQHTTNVAVLHDLATGTERNDSLGTGFYQPLQWSVEAPAQPGEFGQWMESQTIAWWLRNLGGDVYAAGFSLPYGPDGVSLMRWVFATPATGPFAESAPTDAQPAFLRDGQLYSVRIRRDGRTEMLVGPAPPR